MYRFLHINHTSINFFLNQTYLGQESSSNSVIYELCETEYLSKLCESQFLHL